MALEDEKVSYYDGEVSLGYRLFDTEKWRGYITAGYRFIDLFYEYDDGGRDLEVDAGIGGPYLAFCLTF